MSIKNKLFNYSLFLHKLIANSCGHNLVVVHKDTVNIPKMRFDKYNRDVNEDFFQAKTYDYVRMKTLELVAKQINDNFIPGDVAEAGVFLGDFAKQINYIFPHRKLFLYDTFEGFDVRDTQFEYSNSTVASSWLRNGAEVLYANEYMTPEQQIEYIRKRMVYPNNCIFNKGYFPESAKQTNNRFAFVSIDMDLYKPILAAILFFYPRLSKGGYIFIHDYNDPSLSEGIHKAIRDAEKKIGAICKVPIADSSGTLVLTKN